MSQTFTIRDANAADAAALSLLKLACFDETFGPAGFAIPYPPTDLALFIEAAYGLENVTRELADPTHHTWVAQDASGALVAYCHIGPGKLPHPDFRDGDGELYQLYLLRRAQGAGLGKQLLDLALDRLAASGRPIWLGVWSLNLKAQHVYKARGFEIVGGYQFAVGDWRDDEFIMRRVGG
jgi:ribosomal protein S18 acetylase RimI-like enzyme